jgi:transposase
MDTKTPNQQPERSLHQGVLFELPQSSSPASAPTKPAGGGIPRLRRANRHQVVVRAVALDQLLPEDHQARLVWEYVDGLDFTPLYERILAVEGWAGRRPADPKILMALWLYATLQGVGSARQLDRLCRDHVAYQWICGDVSMNYHTLSDFRTDHAEFLDKLLSESVAVLMHEGLVDLKRVAQDGMRVRASAGAASFRRGRTLQECLQEAEEHVATLRAELEADPAAATKRQRSARERSARERTEKIKNALGQLPEVEAKKKPKDREKARVSTTDPEARVMKMADGGYRPAYNVEFATDTLTQVITGVDVINSGSDQGQMAPMVEQLEERYQQLPEEMLVDGGFAKKEDITKVSPPEGDTVVYAPVQKSKDPDRDPHTPRADDSPAVAEWRRRMATEEAKEIYKERAATAECVNAIARNRGFQQFRVRGLLKARAITLWYVLAHNLIRAATLRAKVAIIVE